MSKIKEFYVDAYRKAIITKSGNSNYIAVVDSLPYTVEKKLYEEIFQFSEVIITRRKIEANADCSSKNNRYSVIEEAVCLENQENCTVISYVVDIECPQHLNCEEEIIELIKCIASKY
jgi:hypothetical protein